VDALERHFATAFRDGIARLLDGIFRLLLV